MPHSKLHILVWENHAHKLISMHELNFECSAEVIKNKHIIEIKRSLAGSIFAIPSILLIILKLIFIRLGNLKPPSSVCYMLLLPNSSSVKNLLCDLAFSFLFPKGIIKLYTDGGNKYTSYSRPLMFKQLLPSIHISQLPRLKVNTLHFNGSRFTYEKSSFICLVNIKQNTSYKMTILKIANTYKTAIRSHCELNNSSFTYVLSFHPRFSRLTVKLIAFILKVSIPHSNILVDNKSNRVAFGSAISMPSTLINELAVETPLLLLISKYLLISNHSFKELVNSYQQEGRICTYFLY